jgi:ADP-ribose pyrophosphatase YjhB (NUDIX family)
MSSLLAIPVTFNAAGNGALMATLGAFAAIFESDKILLVEQAYPPFRWTQPGGRIEQGETPEQAVVREILEETGLMVAIEELIGIYHAAYKDDVVFHFLCSVAGGSLSIPEAEIRSASYFAAHELPTALAFNTRVRIGDAFAKTGLKLRVLDTPETIKSTFPKIS